MEPGKVLEAGLNITVNCKYSFCYHIVREKSLSFQNCKLFPPVCDVCNMYHFLIRVGTISTEIQHTTAPIVSVFNVKPFSLGFESWTMSHVECINLNFWAYIRGVALTACVKYILCIDIPFSCYVKFSNELSLFQRFTSREKAKPQQTFHLGRFI